jgi:hypothetical protein
MPSLSSVLPFSILHQNVHSNANPSSSVASLAPKSSGSSRVPSIESTNAVCVTQTTPPTYSLLRKFPIPVFSSSGFKINVCELGIQTPISTKISPTNPHSLNVPNSKTSKDNKSSSSILKLPDQPSTTPTRAHKWHTPTSLDTTYEHLLPSRHNSRCRRTGSPPRCNVG